jgi:regulatory protein
MPEEDLSRPLRRKVTRIEPQVRRPTRVSVFLDGEFAFGVDRDLIHRHGIREGSELTEEDVERLLFEDECGRIKEQAFRFLAVRDHSERELQLKLQQKGYSAASIRWVLDFLKHYNLLDDRSFAEAFARERVLRRPMGPLLLRAELQKKGIHSDLIDRVVERIFRDVNEVELARKAIAQKVRHQTFPLSAKDKKKLADFLLRRGFVWDTVRTVLEELEVSGGENEFSSLDDL